MQGRSVSPEIAGTCNSCPDYLNSCMPVVDNGLLFGECDKDFCCECYRYAECCKLKEVMAYTCEGF